MSTYDSWLCEPPRAALISHPEAYPSDYECGCGDSEWTWDWDAEAWFCQGCGEYLNAGRYRIYEPWELAEDARLSAAGL